MVNLRETVEAEVQTERAERPVFNYNLRKLIEPRSQGVTNNGAAAAAAAMAVISNASLTVVFFFC